MRIPLAPSKALIMGIVVGTCVAIGATDKQPAPTGCIYFAVYDPVTPEPVVRDTDGKITAVLTPIKRTESLRKRWSLGEFELVVREIETKREKDPMYGANSGVPVGAAWASVKATIQQGDEIWTFGALDVGTVVIRNQRVVCLVVTEHQW
jgi:hypothetical protein